MVARRIRPRVVLAPTHPVNLVSANSWRNPSKQSHTARSGRIRNTCMQINVTNIRKHVEVETSVTRTNIGNESRIELMKVTERGPPLSLEPGSGFPFYFNNAILRLTDLHLLLGAPQGFERSPISESALPGASVLYAIHVTHIFHLFVIPRSDNALSVLAGNQVHETTYFTKIGKM